MVKRVNMPLHGNKGKAWGIHTWRGKTEECVRQIPSTHKRQWGFIHEPPEVIQARQADYEAKRKQRLAVKAATVTPPKPAAAAVGAGATTLPAVTADHAG